MSAFGTKSWSGHSKLARRCIACSDLPREMGKSGKVRNLEKFFYYARL
jgi:hypothetical protein